MWCPLLDLLSVSRQRPDIRKEVARIDLGALFASQRPVTENFNGNLEKSFVRLPHTIRNNFLHKEL
jgi:hypothetical protein